MTIKIYDKEVNGLYVRQGKRGGTWNYARSKNGKLFRASLGPTSVHTVQAARRWATNLNLQGAEVTPSWTLGEVAAKAMEKAKLKKYRDPGYVLYRVELHSKDWLDRRLLDITKADVNDRHDTIAAKSGPAAAAQWVAMLKILYRFAENSMGYEGRHPTKGVETAPIRARQVVWTQEQLDAFLAACSDNEYWHSYFTIVAFTGMRRSNVAAMEWAEISGSTWTIPASKFKTKVAHTVHLHERVMAVLQRRPKDGPYVFPARSTGHLKDAYPAFQRICKAAGITGVTIHDLRRTLGSKLAAKVPLPVVAKVLGHKTINTTMRSYAVISDEDAKAAISLIG